MEIRLTDLSEPISLWLQSSEQYRTERTLENHLFFQSLKLQHGKNTARSVSVRHERSVVRLMFRLFK